MGCAGRRHGWGLLLLGALGLYGPACGGGGAASGGPTGAAGASGLPGADSTVDPSVPERVALRISVDAALQAELIVEAADRRGLRRLSVFDPDGRLVLDQQAGPGAAVGVNEVRAHAEPGPGRAFPEGIYRIEGVTADGVLLLATAALVFDLLPAPELLDRFLAPVHPDQVEIAWAPVPEAQAIVVEIEEGETQVLAATFPPSASGFAVPPGVLSDETEYELVVIVVSASGNRTESEATFVTGSRGPAGGSPP